MPEVPKQIGKYTVTRALGKGAMGMVYEGFDPVIERKVAIKTILKDYLEGAEMEDAVVRFKREAQAGGRLQHPSIVAVYEYGNTEDGTAFKLAGAPVQFGPEPPTTHRAPGFSEHGDEILQAIGLDEDAILDLKVRGVVA